MTFLANYTGVAILQSGTLSPNAKIEVRRESDGNLANIYSDEAGTTPISQPGFVANSEGLFTFYAPGVYRGLRIKVEDAGQTEEYTLRNQSAGSAGQVDVSAYMSALLLAANAGEVRTPLDVFSKTEARTLLASAETIVNGYLAWSVAGNVLTVAVKTLAGQDPSAADPVALIFRSATVDDGLPVVRLLTSATSVAVSNGSTLGTINSTPFRLWCVAFDDGGTVRLAVINCLAGSAPNFSIYPLGAWPIASATQETDGADSAHVFYSDGAAVASKAYAVVGYATWEAGLATAGTWSAGPTRKQLFGPGVPLPGALLNQVREQTGAVATTTTQMPLDDTIPQNTEGAEVLDVSITPTSAANVLNIEAHARLAHSAAGHTFSSALFHDSVANALTAGSQTMRGSGDVTSIAIAHQMLASTTSVKTFDLRVGVNTAGTTTFNGFSSGRNHGGVNNSFLKATEIMA